jgi:hypothetical protein
VKDHREKRTTLLTSEPRMPAIGARTPALLGDGFPGYANKRLVTDAAGGDHLLLLRPI